MYAIELVRRESYRKCIYAWHFESTWERESCMYVQAVFMAPTNNSVLYY